MNNNHKMLDEEIERRIEELASLVPGSDEDTKAIDNFAKLYKLRIEENKALSEDDERYIRRNMDKENLDREAEAKVAETKTYKIDRYVRWALEGAGIVLPMIFYSTWMKRGFEFEREGTFTSTTFRGLFGKFRPTK